MHSILAVPAFYVDPGSGSMVLQLLLGGVSGIYVVFRLFKHKVLRMLGIRSDDEAAELPAPLPLSEYTDQESAHRRRV